MKYTEQAREAVRAAERRFYASGDKYDEADLAAAEEHALQAPRFFEFKLSH